MIRNGDQNLFIAECKFWGGSQQFLKTIDQLEGYITWRDTKTAIIIFNRNKNFTNVLNTINKSILKHKDFIRFLDKNEQGRFQAVFRHPNDRNREFYLSVLAFDIPQFIDNDLTSDQAQAIESERRRVLSLNGLIENLL